MLKSTNCYSDEEEIIKIINNGNKYLWIRNSNIRNKERDLDFLVKYIKIE